MDCLEMRKSRGHIIAQCILPTNEQKPRIKRMEATRTVLRQGALFFWVEELIFSREQLRKFIVVAEINFGRWSDGKHPI